MFVFPKKKNIFDSVFYLKPLIDENVAIFINRIGSLTLDSIDIGIQSTFCG